MTTSEVDVCLGCGKEWDTDDCLFCDDCETAFWKDPKAVLDYFHFCGIPATIEQIQEMIQF